jgi:hypothetical protein
MLVKLILQFATFVKEKHIVIRDFAYCHAQVTLIRLINPEVVVNVMLSADHALEHLIYVQIVPMVSIYKSLHVFKDAKSIHTPMEIYVNLAIKIV